MLPRRRFLGDLTRMAALCAIMPNEWQITWHPRFADDPFALGVASGDPTSTGAVIWTRLAPRPFEPEGGMPGTRPIVDWEVADDEQFTRIVRKGRYTAAPELSYSVHVDVEGLEADRWYCYRFRSGGAVSPVGRLRTAPAEGALTPLRFGMVSCQNYEQGLYTAYQHLAQERCDLITHLGDYIYEYSARAGAVRPHRGFEIRSLDDYRTRYAQYKLDPLLQAAHALCPWLVTWDDHEV
ncbi:MAG: alkaline phosphatase D family protein, partial [Gemmatimonadaceae bacterium]